jgi:hypothetical protein
MLMPAMELDSLQETSSEDLEVVYSAEMAKMNPPEPNSSEGGIKHWLHEFKDSILVVVMLGIGAWVIHFHIPALIDTQTKAMSVDVGKLQTSMTSAQSDIGEIKKDVGEIRKDIKDTLTRALDRVYQSPPRGGPHGELQRGVAAIELASNLKVQLDANVVRRFGSDAIKTTSRNPELREIAWRGVQLSLEQVTTQTELRSLIDGRRWMDMEDLFKFLSPAMRAEQEGLYSTVFKGVKLYFTPPKPSAENCTMAVRIGNLPKALQFNLRPCAELSRFVGEEPMPSIPPIDGYHFRNVIFQNVRLEYLGGPIILENVHFINCQFNLPINIQTETFADKILNFKEVTFKQLG